MHTSSPATLRTRDPLHLMSIQRSHERCCAFGLDRGGKPDPDPAARADLALVRQRNSRLFNHAAPVMELLFQQIVDTESMVVLTDTSGMILHSIGDHDFLARASRVALAPGVSWDEKSKGTNAIGTALINQAPTLVHADEHFIRANHFLTCSAAPIFDPRGEILGVLDVTGDHRSYHGHTMGLVKMSAQMVENHWLTAEFGNVLRLHFHTRPEFIGTLLEGIIAIGNDGRILGWNRSALEQLEESGASLRLHSVSTLFGVSIGQLVDHFRARLATPMRLQTSGTRSFVASARFDWPVQHATTLSTARLAGRSAGPSQVHAETGVRAAALQDAGPAEQDPQGAALPTRTLEEQEIEMIRQAVTAAAGNISVASRRLGISRNTIYRKLRWKR